jgi:hypothetical protein
MNSMSGALSSLRDLRDVEELSDTHTSSARAPLPSATSALPPSSSSSSPSHSTSSSPTSSASATLHAPASLSSSGTSAPIGLRILSQSRVATTAPAAEASARPNENVFLLHSIPPLQQPPLQQEHLPPPVHSPTHTRATHSHAHTHTHTHAQAQTHLHAHAQLLHPLLASHPSSLSLSSRAALSTAVSASSSARTSFPASGADAPLLPASRALSAHPAHYAHSAHSLTDSQLLLSSAAEAPHHSAGATSPGASGTSCASATPTTTAFSAADTALTATHSPAVQHAAVRSPPALLLSSALPTSSSLCSSSGSAAFSPDLADEGVLSPGHMPQRTSQPLTQPDTCAHQEGAPLAAYRESVIPSSGSRDVGASEDTGDCAMDDAESVVSDRPKDHRHRMLSVLRLGRSVHRRLSVA